MRSQGIWCSITLIMESVTAQVEARYKKKAVASAKSGDSVRVSQKVREGSKERVQVFEGMVIKVKRKNELTASITVRRISSGVGVEKSFLLHSPSVLKVEVIKRSKVRRNYLSYMRQRAGKSTRLAGIEFDKEAVNVAQDEAVEAEEEKLKEAAEKAHEVKEAKQAEKVSKQDAKAQAAMAEHEAKTDPEPAADKS